MTVVKPYQEVAVAFAAALVAHDFARACGMLTPDLRGELSEQDLEERLTRMYRSYADGAPLKDKHKGRRLDVDAAREAIAAASIRAAAKAQGASEATLRRALARTSSASTMS